MDVIKRVIMVFITILFIISCSSSINYAIPRASDDPKILLKISQNGKKGLKNTDGVIVLKPIYQDFGIDQINGMLAVKRENKWGFIDKNFNEVIKPAYDEVIYFFCGWCPVKVGNLWGLIDTNGRWMVKPLYDSIEISQETKLAIISKKGKYGLIDSNGKVKINTKYEKMNFLKDGMLSFVKNGKTGMVNEKGVEVIPAEYKGIYRNSIFPDKSKYNFSVQIEQEVPAKGGFYIKNKTGIVEKSGRITILDKYEIYYAFNDDLLGARDQFNYTMGLVDINLNTLVKQIYTQIDPYLDDEFIAVKYGRYHGTITRNGQEIIKPIYTYMAKVGENLLVCSGNLKGGKWGIVDKNGKIIVPIKYSYAKTNGEYVCFQENGLWGILDANGGITAKPQFTKEPEFTENNLILVRNYQNAGFFNIKGEPLTKEYSKSLFPFDNANLFRNGFAPVELDGKWGFIDITGELVILYKFDDINGSFENGVAWVSNIYKDGKKYGLINTKGDYLFDTKFNDLASNLIIGVYSFN